MFNLQTEKLETLLGVIYYLRWYTCSCYMPKTQMQVTSTITNEPLGS